MFGNVDPRFLPAPEHRPQLTFGHPDLQFVHYRQSFNAADELLDATIRRLGGDRVAIHEPARERSWTYRELQGAVNRLGNGLKRLGLQPGDRVLIRIPDVAEMAIAQLAVWKVGGIVVPTSVLERAREIAFMVNDTEASLALVDAEYLEEVVKARTETPTLREVVAVPAGPGDTVSYQALLEESSEVLPPYPNHPLDGSGIYYTGGTTGHPKGCLHTHAAEVLLADLTAAVRRAGPDDVFLTHAPIGHAFGNGEKINFPLRIGASAVYSQRPSPRQMFELAERYGATILAGAATMYRMMLREEADPRATYPRLVLRSALSSGEILDRPTQDRWGQLLGFPLRNVVGMTPIRHIFIESNRDGDKVAPGLSVGAPIPGYEARLVDAVTGGPLEPGEPGRLALRGPSGITYWTNLHPFIRERAAQDVREGWSLLDDAYSRDEEGWLWFQTRLDDMIVTGGRQVAAPEVEAVMREHPAVAEVAVVAAADELRGQVVMAYVVLRPGPEAGPALVQELQEFAKREMAAYKYPREIEFLSELPRDPVGKIQRRMLRQRAADRRPSGASE
ncbi:MAG TPA: AMP-binding protein [Solirubrobacterales bacterium]